MSYRNRLTAALAFSIAAALSAPAGAQNKEPIKLAIGVDAAYVWPVRRAREDALGADFEVDTRPRIHRQSLAAESGRN